MALIALLLLLAGCSRELQLLPVTFEMAEYEHVMRSGMAGREGYWRLTVDCGLFHYSTGSEEKECKVTANIQDLGLFHPKSPCELARIIGSREACVERPSRRKP